MHCFLFEAEFSRSDEFVYLIKPILWGPRGDKPSDKCLFQGKAKSVRI